LAIKGAAQTATMQHCLLLKSGAFMLRFSIEHPRYDLKKSSAHNVAKKTGLLGYMPESPFTVSISNRWPIK
jgi:hypothetical protein